MMKKHVPLALIVCLAGCVRAEIRSVTVPEVEALASSGYRGAIVVYGYYYFHPEEDALFPNPIPEDPHAVSYDDLHVILSLAPILEKEKITDWRARQKHMEPLHRRWVKVTGELRKEPLQLGGPVDGNPRVWTFVRVERIERANKTSEGNRQAQN